MTTRTAVIGSGVMGIGVAHVAAAAGHRVVLVDSRQEVIERAEQALRTSIRQHALLGIGPAPDIKELFSRVDLTDDLSAVADADVVVENVFERIDVKREVWRELGVIVSTDALLAANTSAIPVAEFSVLVPAPERVVGIHFMNPVPLKPMVEVIRGPATSDLALEQARQFLEQLGKEAVVVQDSPGFVTNRVLMLMVNEAARLVDEGVATPAEIDRLFKGCFSHKSGPFETIDLIGVDTIVDTLEILRQQWGDDRYGPARVLLSLRAEGRLGRKSGSGFYIYGGNGNGGARQ